MTANSICDLGNAIEHIGPQFWHESAFVDLIGELRVHEVTLPQWA